MRRKRNLQKRIYSILYEISEDADLKQILDKQVDGLLVHLLNKDEIEKLWELVYFYLQDNVQYILYEANKPPNGVEAQELMFVQSIITLAQETIEETQGKGIKTGPKFLQQTMMVFQLVMLNPVVNENVRIAIAHATQFWCSKFEFNKDVFSANLLQYYLFRAVHPDKKKKSDLVKLWLLHKSLLKVSLEEESTVVLRNLLKKTVRNSWLLSCQDGLKFVSFLFTFNVDLILELQKLVRAALLECSLDEAEVYGRMYILAWNDSLPEMKQVLEKQCLAPLVGHIFIAVRSDTNKSRMGPLGLKLLRLMQPFYHVYRHADIDALVVRLYQPLIWRSLVSSNNIIRCNAAQVLFEAYPQMKQGHVSGRIAYIKRQQKAMANLLQDNCHVARAYAVREVCRVMGSFWQMLPPKQIQSWVNTLLQLAGDATSPRVREAVYCGFTTMLESPDCAEYLTEVLPSLGGFFHDPSLRVRLAFVEMLLAVKKRESCKFWRIVSLEQLVKRLEVDDKQVGKKITDLLFDSFFKDDLTSRDTVLNLLLHLVKISRQATRVFFLHVSKSHFDARSCVHLMVAILDSILAYLRQRETKSASPRLSRKRRRGSNKENSPKEGKATQQEKADSLDDPQIMMGFLDIVAMVWTGKSQILHKPENAHLLGQLESTFCSCLPLYMRYFKDNFMLVSILYMASFVPLARSMPVMNLESFCVARLRGLTVDDPEALYTAFVVPLTMWKGGTFVLNQAKEWVDQALRPLSLNESHATVKLLRSKRVKFAEATNPKPMVGLRLLDTMFIHPACIGKLRKYSYTQLLQFSKYLHVIKKLIEQRLSDKQPLEPPLTDEFLTKCFARYLRLNVLLHNSEEKFDAVEQQKIMIDWTIRTLAPHVADTEPDFTVPVPLAVTLLRTLVLTVAEMVSTPLCSIGLIGSMSVPLGKLLDTGCGVLLTHSASCLAVNMLEYSSRVCGKDRGGRTFRVLVSTLLNRILHSLSHEFLPQEHLSAYIEDTKWTKDAVKQWVGMGIKQYRPKCNFTDLIFAKIIDALVASISCEIKLVEDATPVEKLHDLPCVTVMLWTHVPQQPLAVVALARQISEVYLEDSLQLFSGIFLLHTLVLCPGPVNRKPLAELDRAVVIAKKVLPRLLENDSDSQNEDCEDINLAAIATEMVEAMEDTMNKYLERMEMPVQTSSVPSCPLEGTHARPPSPVGLPEKRCPGRSTSTVGMDADRIRVSTSSCQSGLRNQHNPPISDQPQPGVVVQDSSPVSDCPQVRLQEVSSPGSDCPQVRLHEDSSPGSDCPQVRLQEDSSPGSDCPQVQLHEDSSRGSDCPQVRLHEDSSPGSDCPQVRLHEDSSPGSDCPQVRLHEDSSPGSDCRQLRLHQDDFPGSDCPQLRLHQDRSPGSDCPQPPHQDSSPRPDCPQPGYRDSYNSPLPGPSGLCDPTTRSDTSTDVSYRESFPVCPPTPVSTVYEGKGKGKGKKTCTLTPRTLNK